MSDNEGEIPFMPVCVTCQAPLEGPVCTACGTPADAAAPPDTDLLHLEDDRQGMSDDEAGALCYLGWFVTGMFFLWREPYKKSKAIRFHAMQSILLSSFWVLVVFNVGLFVPFRLRETAFWLVQLVTLALWLAMMWSTWKGRRVVLPVLGPMAEKQA